VRRSGPWWSASRGLGPAFFRRGVTLIVVIGSRQWGKGEKGDSTELWGTVNCSGKLDRKTTKGISKLSTEVGGGKPPNRKGKKGWKIMVKTKKAAERGKQTGKTRNPWSDV